MTTSGTTAPGSSSGSLQVVLSVGTNIPTELAQQMDAAVHRAVLSQLAQVDVGPGFRMEVLPPQGATAATAVAAAPASEPIYGIFIKIEF